MIFLVKQDLRPSGVLQGIIARQLSLSKFRGRKLKLRKPPKQRPPSMPQREYYAALKIMVDDLKSVTDKMLTDNQLKAFVVSANALRPDAVRFDRFAEDIRRVILIMQEEFWRQWSEEDFYQSAEDAARNTNRFNKSQFSKTMNRVLGVDVTAGDPWLAQEIEAFTLENVRLIKSIPQTHFEKVQQSLFRDIMAGKSIADISDNLKSIDASLENKAKLIARDQIGKFNGNLTKLRQKDVGLKEYRWSASNDDRVRPEHEERDGEVFSWDEPPDDGHPGEAVNCRCVALPMFEQLLDGADADEENF